MYEWFCLDCAHFADDGDMRRETEHLGKGYGEIAYVFCPDCGSGRVEPEVDVKNVAETAQRIHLEGGRSQDEAKRSLAWMTVAECLDFIVEVS